MRKQQRYKHIHDPLLTSKLQLDRTGPSKVSRVDPYPSVPDDHPVGCVQTLAPGTAARFSGYNTKPCVSVMRCKPCANPHDDSDSPMHLPKGLSICLLTQYIFRFSPPFHAAVDDVESDLRIELIELDTILSHPFARGRGGGKIAVMYETWWRQPQASGHN